MALQVDYVYVIHWKPPLLEQTLNPDQMLFFVTVDSIQLIQMWVDSFSSQPNAFYVPLEHLDTFMENYSHPICLYTPEQHPATIGTADSVPYQYFTDRHIPVTA
ncbi:hypothetical protein CDAR_256321 [Caerostris darwini]|uniref:Uncharacterized protein n=1 Tax=Caerostris darwini TaxID=1538125 RepID=A0AAV4TTY9_9ARAC|nr:hypothetical protein CDAR_256321 [Caerostris darwini]